jgi:hypothetical protein
MPLPSQKNKIVPSLAFLSQKVERRSRNTKIWLISLHGYKIWFRWLWLLVSYDKQCLPHSSGELKIIFFNSPDACGKHCLSYETSLYSE